MSNDRSRDRRDAVFDCEEKKNDANLRAKRANFFFRESACDLWIDANLCAKPAILWLV